MATRPRVPQKYASVEHAPRLEQAVGLWERAAEARPRLAKLRRVEATPGAGELFQASGLRRLLRRGHPRAKGDPAPPDVLAEPTGRRRRRRGGGLRPEAPRRRGNEE